VRVDMIRAFKNVISEQNANKGIIVTTSYFTTDAKREQTPYILDFKDKGDIMDWVKDYQQKRTI
jgi:restriction system protein